MQTTLTPRPRYDSTAVRPAWTDLPQHVRRIVEQQLGGPVEPGPVAGGGFTPGFAAVLEGPAGRQFVKAVDGATHPFIASCYSREALINQALPPGVPAPRLRWIEEADTWVVLAFDTLDHARMPTDPWQSHELAATLEACTQTAEALAQPSQALLDLGLKPLHEEGDFDEWRQRASNTGQANSLPRWLPRSLIGPLADLESSWAKDTAGESVLHHDLRRDNVLIGPAGEASICDWNWPTLGAPWFDLTLLLATAHADGYNASALFTAHPAARTATPEQLDSALAAISGYFISSGAKPTPDFGSPWLRQHQTWSGEVVLRWLAERRHWDL
ncbi:phosphotransferase family protein [Streptacidiphilus sp. EB103A]|uniref:phosphotransferase family protein n=1 Tax=Streptacidiphilus sp. EB103A TaxID=3156275 RepID=UPI00351752E6